MDKGRPSGAASTESFFNAANLLAVAGSDTSDVLRKVPMVRVDGSGGWPSGEVTKYHDPFIRVLE